MADDPKPSSGSGQKGGGVTSAAPRRTKEHRDIHDFHGWFAVEPWRLAIAAAPKCGTRSIIFSIARHFFPDVAYDDVSPSEWRKIGPKLGVRRYIPQHASMIPKNYTRVGVVREPLERFASLWRCQIRDGLSGIADRCRISTPEQLFDLIHARPSGNIHWMPQYPLLEGGHEVVRLENLAAWWDGFFGNDGPELHAVNTTDGETPMNDELADRVRGFYSRDAEIYQDA